MRRARSGQGLRVLTMAGCTDVIDAGDLDDMPE